MRRQFEGGDNKASICEASSDYSRAASDRGNTVCTHTKKVFLIKSYRIARNFRGLKFSRMSLAQTFRDLIFEDCVRAQRRLTVGKIFGG